MGLREELEQRILALGQTPRTVFEKLKKLGVRGERRSSCRCPIAQYLNQDLPLPKDQEVHVHSVWVEVNPGATLRVHLPESVSAFIGAFDRGEYPELEVA